MNHFAWLFVILGVVFLGMGLLLLLSPSIPWLGHLPGDIRIEGAHTRFYFPLATCLLASVILSAIMWFISKFTR
jgi:Protein of unknown function (DUF2905)